MKKKIAHRPSEEDIQRSYFSLRTKRHYSKEMLRKAQMGKKLWIEEKTLEMLPSGYLGPAAKAFWI